MESVLEKTFHEFILLVIAMLLRYDCCAFSHKSPHEAVKIMEWNWVQDSGMITLPEGTITLNGMFQKLSVPFTYS